MKPGKTRRKAIERKRRRYDEANHRQKNSRGPPAWPGGARRRKAIEGKRRRDDKGNQRQKPPADRQHGGGGETKKGENQHEMERWHYLQSREGGGNTYT